VACTVCDNFMCGFPSEVGHSFRTTHVTPSMERKPTTSFSSGIILNFSCLLWKHKRDTLHILTVKFRSMKPVEKELGIPKSSTVKFPSSFPFCSCFVYSLNKINYSEEEKYWVGNFSIRLCFWRWIEVMQSFSPLHPFFSLSVRETVRNACVLFCPVAKYS